MTVKVELLAPAGFTGPRGDLLESVVGTRPVHNFLGSHLPALRRRGWTVELEGKVAPYMESLSFATPVVHVDDTQSGKWFDIGFDFETQEGTSLSQADIHLALRKGDDFFEVGEKTYLIDAESVNAMQNIFSDCASQDGDLPGHFRLANIYAPFVKSALEALDGIDVEDTPSWRNRAGQCNRTLEIEPVSLG